MSRVSPWLALLASVLLFGNVACKPSDINKKYGQRNSILGSDSVNGTAVLASMFEQEGFQVTTWRRLSPRLNNFQVLVWTPDTNTVPWPEERQFLEQWLAGGTNRTLIYVWSDYDAAPKYWEAMEKIAPADQQESISVRIGRAMRDYNSHRNLMPQEQYARWFVTNKLATPRRIEGLKGPWAQGVDVAKTEIYLGTTVEAPTEKQHQNREKAVAEGLAVEKEKAAEMPARKRKRKELDENYVFYEPSYLPQFEKLLESDRGETLVARVTQDQVPVYGETWNRNQIIVVANGSFLLNMPLVNHEHRKLAQRLIESCGEPGKVAFLESDASGLETFHSEPEAKQPTGAEMFAIYPINAILLHAISLGVLFCFARLPIFGRPWSLPSEATSDFGAHITAVAKFLERAGDREHARNQLKYYQEVVKGGAATAKPSPGGRNPAPQPSTESSQ